MAVASPFVCPVLREDGSSLDWARARYEANVEVRSETATVTHRVHEAPELEQLLAAGLAAYALEVRCPKTLYARTHCDRQSRFAVRWSPDEVDGSVFLLPGVVTTKPALLAPTGLIDLWGRRPIDVPVGWWLAKGQIWASENLAASLIEFQRDENLKSGRMRIGEDTTADEPRFIVYLAPDVHERVRTSRDVQVAALVGAFGRIGKSPRFQDDENGSLVVARLREHLREAGVPTWEDEQGWDPALAATTIEGFGVDEIVVDGNLR